MRDELVGQHLNGFYIESLLGRGGMARVYRGVDVRLRRYVAVKVINAVYRDNPQAATRFEREARVVAQLGQHPNVVQIYHYGEDRGHVFIAMQYVEGMDLAAMLNSYRQEGHFMPFEDILAITRDVTSALDFIHGHQVVHRDLKPSNIMLDRSGRAILTDFGLALLVDVGTLGEVFGSPAYIAPEQAMSSAGAKPASDLYSLGVILFEMFTGQQPFHAQDAISLAMQHVNTPPPAPSSVRRGLSREIDRVILKALAKRPEDRYPSGAALLQDLERAVSAAPRPAALPQANLTLPQRVRRETQPLPPPPPVPPPNPPYQPEPPATQPYSTAGHGDLPPATGVFDAQPPQPTAAWPDDGPRVIPIPGGRSKRGGWGLAAVVGVLLAVLLCVGGGLAIGRALASGALSASGRATPILAGVEPSATHKPTKTPIPPTDAPPPTRPPAKPTAAPGQAELTLARISQGHLVLFNSGDQPLRIGSLRLTPSKPQERDEDILGGDMASEMGLGRLEPKECLIFLAPGKKPKNFNNLDCSMQIVIQRQPETGFWMRDFGLFYNEVEIGECREGEDVCVLPIPADAMGQ